MECIEACDRCGGKMVHITKDCGCEVYICYNCGNEIWTAKCKRHGRLSEDRRMVV